MPSRQRSAALRAVTDGDAAVREAKQLTVTEAAESGSQRDLLVAMRARIAVTVQNTECPPRDLASLSRRLQDINKEIVALDARAKQEAREDAGAADEEWNSEAI